MYTNYDIYRFHPTYQTEGIIEFDYTLGCEIPYCEHWQAIWKVNGGYESSIVLGHQSQTLQDFVGESGLFDDFESTEGIDAGDWWEWNCGF